MGPHQKLVLGVQLRHIDYLDEEISRLDKEIKKRMLPFEEDLALFDTDPQCGPTDGRDHFSRNWFEYGSEPSY
jgi:hypothetical protein